MDLKNVGKEVAVTSGGALLEFLQENQELVLSVGQERATAIFEGEKFAYIDLPDLHAGCTLEQLRDHALLVERRSEIAGLILAAEKANIEEVRKLRDAAVKKMIGLAQIVKGIAFDVAVGALKGAIQ